MIFRRDTARRFSRRWAVVAGVTGGVLGALFGMGGPPYVMYIAGPVPEPAARRATIPQMVMLNVGLRVVASPWADCSALARSGPRHAHCPRNVETSLV